MYKEISEAMKAVKEKEAATLKRDREIRGELIQLFKDNNFEKWVTLLSYKESDDDTSGTFTMYTDVIDRDGITSANHTFGLLALMQHALLNNSSANPLVRYELGPEIRRVLNNLGDAWVVGRVSEAGDVLVSTNMELLNLVGLLHGYLYRIR